jgi:hypothetical protein
MNNNTKQTYNLLYISQLDDISTIIFNDPMDGVCACKLCDVTKNIAQRGFKDIYLYYIKILHQRTKGFQQAAKIPTSSRDLLGILG